jgi:hypothetical protein
MNASVHIMRSRPMITRDLILRILIQKGGRDPLETEIDQRQPDEEHDRNEQRDDRGIEAEANRPAPSKFAD